MIHLLYNACFISGALVDSMCCVEQVIHVHHVNYPHIYSPCTAYIYTVAINIIIKKRPVINMKYMSACVHGIISL